MKKLFIIITLLAFCSCGVTDKSDEKMLESTIDELELEMKNIESINTIVTETNVGLKNDLTKAKEMTEGYKEINEEYLLELYDTKDKLEAAMNEIERVREESEVPSGLSDEVSDDINYYPFILSSQKVGWGTFEGYLFGGYYDGEWYLLEDFEVDSDYKIPLVAGKEVYNLCSLNTIIGRFETGYPEYHTDYSAGGEFDTFNYSIDWFRDYPLFVGVSGDWNPLPRIPEYDVDMSWFTIDIDGDGDTEVLEFRTSSDSDTLKNSWYLITDIGESKVFELYDDEWLDLMFADLNGDDVLELIYAGGMHWTSMGVKQFVEGEFVNIGSLYIGD